MNEFHCFLSSLDLKTKSCSVGQYPENERMNEIHYHFYGLVKQSSRF